MAGVNESLKTINSFIRTMLMTVVAGGLGYGGWIGYSTLNEKDLAIKKKERELTSAQEKLAEQDKQIVTLNDDLEKRLREIERLETSLRLLKVDHRVARISVVDQTRDKDTGTLTTSIEFVEVNDEGHPIDSPKPFSFKGDVVYIDHWVVKFEDRFVETGDVDRATSLVLFRRLFGEHQEPRDGFLLEDTHDVPKAYTHGGQPSEFEKKIWANFWTIANDESKAKELGIRAAHGQALSIKTVKGKVYKITLRASDGLSLVPEDSAETSKEAT